MATYVLIPGAGGAASNWKLVAPRLEALGHTALAIQLPAGDDSAGLDEYADAVVEAIGDHTDLVVVAHSLGGFTGPLVCERVPVSLLVLLDAMVPSPGEAPDAWWANSGHRNVRAAQEAQGEDIHDERAQFFHDVPDDITDAAFEEELQQSGTPMEKPWPLDRWPDVPTRVLISRDDRFFPADFQRRVALERLGIEPDEIAGGHLVALSRPDELVARLEAYRTEYAIS